MDRTKLVNEIVDFCIEYGLFKSISKIDELKKRIAYQLNDSAFVESLINTVIVKSKRYGTMADEKIVDLIVELEKVRLDLEYSGESNDTNYL